MPRSQGPGHVTDYLGKRRFVDSGENPDECRRAGGREQRRSCPHSTSHLHPLPCLLTPPPQGIIAKGKCQTRASCSCGLFIPCNQSLFLLRLPNSYADKGMGLRFQRLDDLRQRPSWGQVILIVSQAQGWDWEEVGLATSYCSGGRGNITESRAKLRALH